MTIAPLDCAIQRHLRMLVPSYVHADVFLPILYFTPADSIFYTGTRYPRASRYATDTSNTVASLPPIHVDSLTEKLPAATKIVCIELAENAIALPDFTHPKRCIYIFGAEDYNLSQTTIDRADHTVFIPTSGCLNLAASVNIVLYDRYQKVHHQTMPVAQRNKLVRNSRDCRNNLRVKNPQTTSQ